MTLPAPLTQAAQSLFLLARAHKLMIATAESCTGGLVAASLTAIPGSSSVFERGFVTYSNDAKTAMLGVPSALIGRHGAVSEQVARAMAEGGLKNSLADASLAITGVAGPDGGSDDKPVGTVHIAAARKGATTLHERHLFTGDRDRVREQSSITAMQLLVRLISAESGA